jgi:hypothetical protein
MARATRPIVKAKVMAILIQMAIITIVKVKAKATTIAKTILMATATTTD